MTGVLQLRFTPLGNGDVHLTHTASQWRGLDVADTLEGMHWLFVCTGNICRSPTAERLVAAYADQHGLTQLTASSAGTRAVVGAGVERTAAEVLISLGGDPTGFRARDLTAQQAREADLVLTMSRRHRDRVLELAPGAMRRTFTLREVARLLQHSNDGDSTTPLLDRLGAARARYAQEGSDVDDVLDPIGRDLARFELVGSTIAASLVPLLEHAHTELGRGPK